MLRRFLLCVAISLLAISRAHAAEWQVGFGKVDVTPSEPVRLSGYASRSKAYDGIADTLSVRAMCMAWTQEKGAAESDRGADHATGLAQGPSGTLCLVSVDGILVTSQMAVDIASWAEQKHGLDRSQIVLCASHSHAAPHVDGGLTNLFREPLTEDEQIKVKSYTSRVQDAMQKAINAAFSNREPATLRYGDGEATFAVNRRVLRNGKWAGFGEQDGGAVDHRVRVLLADSPQGKLLGGMFLYACHCTTLGGEFMQVSGDWAGMAASRLETLQDATFLPVIGCGADANPNPRGTYQLAESHASQIVDAVRGVIESDKLTSLTAAPQPFFGYAGLEPEQPTAEAVSALVDSGSPNERRWALAMQRITKDMGRLPETYPMPIHTWRFGDQLSWVFLGGEVVVDYQLQIEKELSTDATWVAAYSDDVFAYVASESMRSQGGYEVDASMIYYMQPGRWATGTQSLVLRRVKEIWQGAQVEVAALSPAEALDYVRVPPGFEVELVASEPLVSDPINVAFGPDGSVWVVEMSDYPLGSAGGGRVKRLWDEDHDGVLDHSDAFLSGLSYPTSVMPWRDGALIIAAPDILYAKDTNSDGRADEKEVWLTGIAPANPQHRASGFELGLDGWLHLGVGHGTKAIRSSKTGQTYNVSGRDIKWNPETGEVRTTTGETQFVRSRDAYGNWFGNSNSHPLFQYVVEQRYLQSRSFPGRTRHDLLTPATAPPVFPRSQTVDRFNDLFARDRFTSACSATIGRVPGLGTDFESVGLVCEPVHNLVARVKISQAGSVFNAVRHPQDVEFDFWTSTDPWSRPVRVINAPDGSVWIVDMVRKVIEHPEWIPTAWQERIDLRAGEGLGRIYRVRESSWKLSEHFVGEEPVEILSALGQQNGAIRELGLLRLIWRASDIEVDTLQSGLRDMMADHANPAVRVAALGGLAAKQWLGADDLLAALDDPDERMIICALRLAETVGTSAELDETIAQLLHRSEEARLKHWTSRVHLQWLLTVSRRESVAAQSGLKQIVSEKLDQQWIARTLSLLVEPEEIYAVTSAIFAELQNNTLGDTRSYANALRLVEDLWERLSEERKEELARRTVQQIVGRVRGLGSDAILAKELLLLSLLQENSELQRVYPESKLAVIVRKRLIDRAVSEDDKLLIANLIGAGAESQHEDLETLRQLLTPLRVSSRVTDALLVAMRRMTAPAAGGLLVEAWPTLPVRQRATACGTLLSRKVWTSALVEGLEKGAIRKSDLDPATVQRLRSLSDRSLRSRCMSVFGQPTERGAVVNRYLKELPPLKDPTKGKALYQQHCAACHSDKDGRPAVGPAIANLGHWTIEQWITGIMDPNKNVEPKYQQVLVVTADDQVHTGLVQVQETDELLLAQPDGTIRRLDSQDVVEIRPTSQSLMPEGFESKLSPSELASILSFLRQ